MWSWAFNKVSPCARAHLIAATTNRGKLVCSKQPFVGRRESGVQLEIQPCRVSRPCLDMLLNVAPTDLQNLKAFVSKRSGNKFLPNRTKRWVFFARNYINLRHNVATVGRRRDTGWKMWSRMARKSKTNAWFKRFRNGLSMRDNINKR